MVFERWVASACMNCWDVVLVPEWLYRPVQVWLTACPVLFSTRDTVAFDTPARQHASVIVAILSRFPPQNLHAVAFQPRRELSGDGGYRKTCRSLSRY